MGVDPWDIDEPIILAEFKCTRCNCTNLHFPDDAKCKAIMETGYGMQIRYYACVRTDCYCHTGAGKPVRILHRKSELGAIVGRT